MSVSSSSVTSSSSAIPAPIAASNPLHAKYPPSAAVTKLTSTLEIKQRWLFNEWGPECQFSNFIRPRFPDRRELDPTKANPNTPLIEATFHDVRGKYALWQSPRENGKWRRVEVQELTLDWVQANVDVTWPAEERFPVSKLDGIVLWVDSSSTTKKRYQLYEGNHRISAWLAAGTPSTLPATLYIGKEKK